MPDFPNVSNMTGLLNDAIQQAQKTQDNQALIEQHKAQTAGLIQQMLMQQQAMQRQQAEAQAFAQDASYGLDGSPQSKAAATVTGGNDNGLGPGYDLSDPDARVAQQAQQQVSRYQRASQTAARYGDLGNAEKYAKLSQSATSDWQKATAKAVDNQHKMLDDGYQTLAGVKTQDDLVSAAQFVARNLPPQAAKQVLSQLSWKNGLPILDQRSAATINAAANSLKTAAQQTEEHQTDTKIANQAAQAKQTHEDKTASRLDADRRAFNSQAGMDRRAAAVLSAYSPKTQATLVNAAKKEAGALDGVHNAQQYNNAFTSAQVVAKALAEDPKGRTVPTADAATLMAYWHRTVQDYSKRGGSVAATKNDAQLAGLLQHGAQWFTSIGSGKNPPPDVLANVAAAVARLHLNVQADTARQLLLIREDLARDHADPQVIHVGTFLDSAVKNNRAFIWKGPSGHTNVTFAKKDDLAARKIKSNTVRLYTQPDPPDKNLPALLEASGINSAPADTGEE